MDTGPPPEVCLVISNRPQTPLQYCASRNMERCAAPDPRQSTCPSRCRSMSLDEQHRRSLRAFFEEFEVAWCMLHCVTA